MSHTVEREYIFDIILSEFLGLDYVFSQSDRKDIKLFDNNGSEIIISDYLFSKQGVNFQNEKSLPELPLKLWDVSKDLNNAKVVGKEIPVIFGNDPNDSNFYKKNNNKIEIGLDIFGSSFFMLTRYEELVKKDRDLLDRFQAKDSIAFQEDFLERPIINEYLDILWTSIKYIWPRIIRRKKEFCTTLSHDVDNPFEHVFSSFFQMSKSMAGDFFKRYSIKKATIRPLSWYKANYIDIKFDQKNTFDFIMDTSEKNNLKSTFNFIADHSNKQRDGVYSLDNKHILNLLKKINDRGHLIGMHGSFDSYNNIDQLKKEFNILKETCKELEISQKYWGARQHYLRFDIPITLQYLNDIGLHYDESLGYADHSGFRCGVCYDYPAFNIVSRQKLNIIIRPLIVMECSVLDYDYMNLNIQTGEAFNKMVYFKNICESYNGNFTLLWHNDRLVKTKERQLFLQVLKG